MQKRGFFMATPLQSIPAECSTTTSTNQNFNWNWINALPLQQRERIHPRNGMREQEKYLEGSALSCDISPEVGSWENRKIFLETMGNRVMQHCKQHEKLVIVSLGSNMLLMEYLFALWLFQKGYDNVFFFQIDSSYRFFPDAAKVLLSDFRNKMSDAYQNTFHTPLPVERIHNFTNVSKVSKYTEIFNEKPHVLLMECMPPDAVKFGPELRYEGKRVFVGSGRVPREEANTVVFLPDVMANIFEEQGQEVACWPIFPVNISSKGGGFLLNWGCKIYDDGKFLVTFSGSQEIYKDKPESADFFKDIEFKLGQWFKEQIAIIRQDTPKRRLTQAEKTLLLESAVLQVSVFLQMTPYYLTDYEIDRTTLRSFLSEHAGNQFRHNMVMKLGENNECEILENSI
jgi:hypothetical protein